MIGLWFCLVLMAVGVTETVVNAIMPTNTISLYHLHSTHVSLVSQFLNDVKPEVKGNQRILLTTKET